MMKIRSNRAVVVLGALILAGAFLVALFHFHADGHSHHDCPVCRLVQTFGLLFAFALIAFAGDPARARGFSPVSISPFQSRFLTSRLKDRAPPLLF